MRGAGRQRDRTEKRQEEEERQGGKKKQKRKLCPSGTFKGAHVP